MLIRLIKLAIVLGIGFAATMAVLLLVGPRMQQQPKIKTYQISMPEPPRQSVRIGNRPRIPTEQEAKTLQNPLKPNPENIAAGKTFYGYYCTFCHGSDGRGFGPVGESYVPLPANLASNAVQSYTDGQLLRASLTGEGHRTVINRVMNPRHRWYVMLYVRTLGEQPPSN